MTETSVLGNHFRFSLLASMIVCGSLVMQNGLAEDQTSRSTQPTDWTPLLASVRQVPSAFQGSDNRYNLVYELLIDNYFHNQVELRSLEILDGNGQVLKRLDAKHLLEIATAVGFKGATMTGGTRAVVFVNLDFPDEASVPKTISHRLTYNWTNQLAGAAKGVTTGAQFSVDARKPVTISSPLKGTNWVAVGGYSGRLGHRRALFPLNNALYNAQRYAIDWIQLDSEKRATLEGSSQNANWFSYGKPVFAVADGTIDGVMDKFPDQLPDKAKGSERISYPGGNLIVQSIGGGNFAFYAHLKPGSIRVKAGDVVKRGQEIALLGNSGNTTGPHLHFHVVDGPSPLQANGVPYVFDRFKQVGEVISLDDIDNGSDQTRRIKIRSTTFDGEHRLQLPREGVLVDFVEGEP